MRRWLPLLAISLSTFMLLVDLTIVSIAAPAIASGLDSSFAALQWTIDVFLVNPPVAAVAVLVAPDGTDTTT